MSADGCHRGTNASATWFRIRACRGSRGGTARVLTCVSVHGRRPRSSSARVSPRVPAYAPARDGRRAERFSSRRSSCLAGAMPARARLAVGSGPRRRRRWTGDRGGPRLHLRLRRTLHEREAELIAHHRIRPEFRRPESACPRRGAARHPSLKRGRRDETARAASRTPPTATSLRDG